MAPHTTDKSVYLLWTVMTFHIINTHNFIGMEGRSYRPRKSLGYISTDSNYTRTMLQSGGDFKNWIFREPVSLDLIKQHKQQRLKRSVHKDKISANSFSNISPYSSIVYLGVGCVGTLISPIHVLTAAHCVHDGKKLRTGPRMNPLKIGLLRRKGRQHKIRVKKIFFPKAIRPTTESRFSYDYAVLKLVRPHKKPYLPVKASKGSVRALTFHVFEKERGSNSLSMYKYTHCPVINKRVTNYYKILAEHCPSSSGDSGTAVFDSSEDNGHSVIGVLSAWARYKFRSGYYFATVILRLSEFDVAKINQWIRNS